MEDPAQRGAHRIHFMKTLAVLGGPLVVAATPPDRPEPPPR